MFDKLVDAAKALCDFAVRDSKQNAGTPSIALKIGYGLKKCVNVVVGRALTVRRRGE